MEKEKNRDLCMEVDKIIHIPRVELRCRDSKTRIFCSLIGPGHHENFPIIIC